MIATLTILALTMPTNYKELKFVQRCTDETAQTIKVPHKYKNFKKVIVPVVKEIKLYNKTIKRTSPNVVEVFFIRF